MRSVRLDPDLDRLIVQAAASEQVSVSDFIREAARERAERTLTPSEHLESVIGVVHGGGGRARDTGTSFTELLKPR